jgi:hypothetical protein
VLLFLEKLPSLPKETLALLRAHPLDLDEPALKLFCADGLGIQGLRAGFKLLFSDGKWHLDSPAFAADVVADLQIATQAERERSGA